MEFLWLALYGLNTVFKRPTNRRSRCPQLVKRGDLTAHEAEMLELLDLVEGR